MNEEDERIKEILQEQQERRNELLELRRINNQIESLKTALTEELTKYLLTCTDDPKQIAMVLPHLQSGNFELLLSFYEDLTEKAYEAKIKQYKKGH